MEMIFSLLAVLGMGYACFRAMKWMLNAGRASVKRDPPLAPNDLKVLEESAARLVSDIRSAADDAVARIERCMNDVEHRLAVASTGESLFVGPPVESEFNAFCAIPIDAPTAYSQVDPDSGKSPAETARDTGLTTGEVLLLQNLRRISSR
jgi:hypothetical protein